MGMIPVRIAMQREMEDRKRAAELLKATPHKADVQGIKDVVK